MRNRTKPYIPTVSPGLAVGLLLLVQGICPHAALAQSSSARLTASNPPTSALFQGVGVSLAGAEFGVEGNGFSNLHPGRVGRDYVYPSAKSVEALAARGIRTFRLPIRWERFQPKLGKALDPQELKQLDQTLDLIAKHQGKVIIDLHNYARYAWATGSHVHSLRIDQRWEGNRPVTSEDLANFWQFLARRYRNHPGLLAYGIMNEPHDMDDSSWQRISQKVVDGIRTVDLENWILVAGDEWSSAERFAEVNGDTAWIRDPAQRTAYEAHCYFDLDASGKYKFSYSYEQRLDPALKQRPANRIKPFADWCRKNQVVGFIGEFGVPNNDPRWNALLEDFLHELRHQNLASCYWAAGQWWGDYPLSVHPGAHPHDDPATLKTLIQFQ